ncbi:pilus assembly protein PilM [Candidatus Falkowbacteria bacterium]|jgi:type IV pilus assembly protein PilM|nr:pilus assembly protein PilM [Elusimicrobiaceae bacterium]MBT4433521.1 pilus assembly protein PilM [Candidatus Falkowbacteria bacterium]
MSYNYLGVNLGTSSIKLVELANNKGTPKLTTYGFTEQSIDIIKDDSELARGEAVRILKRLCKEAGVNTTKAITALPTFSVFSSVISLPKMSKKDLAGAVKWEAKKIIPMPIEDVILDWHILNKEENLKMPGKIKNFFGRIDSKDKNSQEGSDLQKKENNKEKNKDIKILLTGAPKNLVSKYIDIFTRAGLNLLSLETEIFSLVRSLVGNDKSTLMIVDIGAMSTNISLIQNGVAIVNRSIGFGGKNISNEISQNLDVDFNRAEQFKFDIGINAGGQQDSSVFKTVENTIIPIVDEIKYTIDFFKNQLNFGAGQGNSNIEKIILTGGSSMMSYLPEYLSKQLNIKVYIGDPWARVVYPQELKSIFEEIGPKLAVSVGLAMREIE